MDGMTEAAFASLPVDDMARSHIVRQYMRRTLCGTAAPIDEGMLATLAADAFDLHDAARCIPPVVFEVAAEEIACPATLAASNVRTSTMPSRKRTTALSTADEARLNDMSRRTGMTPSAAVRVAMHALDELVEDYEPELDILADELKATESPRVWGYSLPEEDDDLVTSHLRNFEMGARRVSRSELVRFALRRAAAMPDTELRQLFADVDREIVRRPWRSGSTIHADLIALLGSDFKSLTVKDLQDRLDEAFDDRVRAAISPLQVQRDERGIYVEAWRTLGDSASASSIVRLHDTDSARSFGRRLVPFICDAEEGVRQAQRMSKPGRSP